MNLTLTLEGVKDREDIVLALQYAAELVGKGYVSGDLRNENIELGTFDLHAPNEQKDEE